ncbi:MAG TPA: hypothetical protein DCE23_04330 [Firmicutes bacterium]|nr:hypothetical protein [Bacillota bacterium]
MENSMCHDITTEQFDLDQELYVKEQELIRIDFKETLNVKKYKSTLIIGNMRINNIKHFNWLQKLMYKLFFGIKVVDIKQAKGDSNVNTNN